MSSEGKFSRELIVTQHKTVKKSGEDPVYEVTLKSIAKDEDTQTALIVKVSTESEQIRDKFHMNQRFTVRFHKQPTIG